jgi:FixJ family two-component response regulator
MPVDRTSRLIAIIDDDEAMQDSLRDPMEAAELVARCFGSAEEFLESGLHRQAACLISDIRMPKMSGLELQARLKDEECDIPIMFITAHGDARMRIQARERARWSSLGNRSIISCCSKRSELHLICALR